MVFTPVQTRRTFEEAVEQIAEKIKLGELRVGDRLPSERALAARAGSVRHLPGPEALLVSGRGTINPS